MQAVEAKKAAGEISKVVFLRMLFQLIRIFQIRCIPVTLFDCCFPFYLHMMYQHTYILITAFKNSFGAKDFITYNTNNVH
jgi:hypothetical protein